MPLNKFIYLLILIYLCNVCFALDGTHNGGSKPVSEIGLEIHPDKKDYLTKQPISIYFNFSNLRNNSDAKNIKLHVELCNIIASPNIDLKISNRGIGEPINTNRIKNIFLESSFDGNKEHNDEVTVYKNAGRVEVEIGTLKRSENLSIRYTSFINKSILGCTSVDICNLSIFSWDYSAKPNPPKIGNINICPNEPHGFSIKIEPEHNVILCEELNCSVFNNSKIYFYPEMSLDEDIDMVFFDDNTQKEIINGSNIISGEHIFSMKKNINSNRSYKNNTVFKVFDAKTYHKSLHPWYLILVLLILLYFTYKLQNVKNRNIILYKNSIAIILIYVVCLYYYYLSPNYVSIKFIEISMILIVFQLSYLITTKMCAEENFVCNPKIYELKFFGPLAFILILTTILLHYIIPEISSSTYGITVFIGIIIVILSIILARSPEKPLIRHRILAATIILLIFFLFYILVIGFTLSFKPKFETIELLFISFLYITPLISIAVTYLSPSLANKILDHVSGKI